MQVCVGVFVLCVCNYFRREYNGGYYNVFIVVACLMLTNADKLCRTHHRVHKGQTTFHYKFACRIISIAQLLTYMSVMESIDSAVIHTPLFVRNGTEFIVGSAVFVRT